MRALMITSGLMLGLAACVAPPPTPAQTPPTMTFPLPSPADDTCGARSSSSLIGQPQSKLSLIRFSQPTRVISPNMAVTMDFIAERLNIHVDATGTIHSLTCG